jgi:hypothetical protein
MEFTSETAARSFRNAVSAPREAFPDKTFPVIRAMLIVAGGVTR